MGSKLELKGGAVIMDNCCIAKDNPPLTKSEWEKIFEMEKNKIKIDFDVSPIKLER